MKAKIMASYSVSTEYDVTVTLSQVSGFVRDASCICKASAMGRCSHIWIRVPQTSAVLRFLALGTGDVRKGRLQREYSNCHIVPRNADVRCDQF